MVKFNFYGEKAIRGSIVLSELIDPQHLVVGAKMKTFITDEPSLLYHIIDVFADMLNKEIIGGFVSFDMDSECTFISREKLHSVSDDEVMLVRFDFRNGFSPIDPSICKDRTLFWSAEELYTMISVGDQITVHDPYLSYVLIKRKGNPRFVEIRFGTGK